MGHWDYQAIELFAHDTAEAVLAALPPTHGFHGNGVITYQACAWLHCGWVTSYGVDARATLDAAFFGSDPPQRTARLHALFGAPAPFPAEGRRRWDQ